MSKKSSFAIALVAFLVMSVGQAPAFELYPDNLSVGAVYGYYDYSEKLESPNKSDESGELFGTRVEYSYRSPDTIFFGINGELLTGDTDYDGTLQDLSGDHPEIDGTPAKGKTDNSLLRYEGLVGWTVLPLDYFMITPFTGYGQLEWDRRLGSEGGAIPFDETYRWRYIPLGVNMTYDLTPRWNVGLTARIDLVIDSSINISGPLFDAEMGIGKKSHYSVELPITYQFSEHWLATITPFYFNRPSASSDLEPVQYGSETIWVMEPESTCTFNGVRFFVKATF